MMSVFSDKECLKWARVSNETRTWICAKQYGTNSCVGDSGGPLAVYEKGKISIIRVSIKSITLLHEHVIESSEND